MQNSSASFVTAPLPVSRQPSTKARACLFAAITELDHAVAAWLNTPAAWDQRTHPSIRQFLVDIREVAVAIERGGKVSPNIIVAAAVRLAGKVHHPAVDRCVDAVRSALDDYLRALHS